MTRFGPGCSFEHISLYESAQTSSATASFTVYTALLLTLVTSDKAPQQCRTSMTAGRLLRTEISSLPSWQTTSIFSPHRSPSAACSRCSELLHSINDTPRCSLRSSYVLFPLRFPTLVINHGRLFHQDCTYDALPGPKVCVPLEY